MRGRGRPIAAAKTGGRRLAVTIGRGRGGRITGRGRRRSAQLSEDVRRKSPVAICTATAAIIASYQPICH